MRYMDDRRRRRSLAKGARARLLCESCCVVVKQRERDQYPFNVQANRNKVRIFGYNSFEFEALRSAFNGSLHVKDAIPETVADTPQSQSH